MKTLLFAAILLVASATVSVAQSPIAGDWTLTFNTPGGTREATASFKVDGENVTGTMNSAEGGQTAMSGTAKGNTFSVTMEVTTPNGVFNVGLSGEVDGDAMKGVMDYGQGTGDFTGKRKN
jgi:hypothetical protein